MTVATDQRWMRLALSLGRRGMGQVWPNPAVGCVLVQGDRVVGRGWTQPGGRPHAEPTAIAQAGALAAGATAYVTLEPCAHHGQTPPCADALIAAGVARVVTALPDPDPRVDGGGHRRLKEAGIEVVEGICAEAAGRDHRGFLSRIRNGRPMVTLKLAMSVDGRIATGSGESQWITGEGARRMGHALRARHDCVLIGAGTARDDDPTLTVRGLGVPRQPVRAVASRNLSVPVPSNLSLTVHEGPVWYLHGSGVSATTVAGLAEAGARCLPVAAGADRQLDPKALLATLGGEGITRVYCEGGGAMAASLLGAGLVDDLVVFTAGMGIGAEGRPGLGVLGLSSLADAERFRLVSTRAVGADAMTIWTRS